jgi:hypothetical protein
MTKRLGIAVGLWLLASTAACGDDGADCGLRTTGLSGEAPYCGNHLECGDDEWELACDGDGTGECVCSKNGQEEKTIPYDDKYCPADFSNADFDAHQAAASEACGWP